MEYEDVIIPYTVLDELDNIKADRRRDRETRYVARRAVRLIKDLDIPCKDFCSDRVTADETFLFDVAERHTIYTKDMLLYEKGKAMERDIRYFDPEIDTYTGVIERTLTPSEFQKFMEHNNIGWDEDLPQNQFIDFGDALGRYKDGQVFRVSWSNKKKISGIDELNRRQIMAYDILFDESIKVIVLWGVAGTGKTALAIKAAIQMTDHEIYENILLSRPNVQIGEELGILPGNIEEKQSPFIQPFRDNMKSFQLSAIPEIQPLSTVKGRDIKDTIYIVDEAQDIPPKNMKMLVERMGHNSKLILTGDTRQVDKRGLTPKYNGISFVANRLKGQDIFACIELTDIERSDIAKLGELLRTDIV